MTVTTGVDIQWKKELFEIQNALEGAESLRIDKRYDDAIQLFRKTLGTIHVLIGTRDERKEIPAPILNAFELYDDWGTIHLATAYLDQETLLRFGTKDWRFEKSLKLFRDVLGPLGDQDEFIKTFRNEFIKEKPSFEEESKNIIKATNKIPEASDVQSILKDAAVTLGRLKEDQRSANTVFLMEKLREDLFLAHQKLKEVNSDAAADVNEVLNSISRLQTELVKRSIKILKYEQENHRNKANLTPEQKHMLAWGYAKRGECYRIISEKPIFFTPKISEHILPIAYAGYNFNEAIRLREGNYPWAEAHGANIIVLLGLLDVLFPGLFDNCGLLEHWDQKIDSDSVLDFAEVILEKVGFKALGGAYSWAKIIYCVMKIVKILHKVKNEKSETKSHLFKLAEIFPVYVQAVSENPELFETGKDPFVLHFNPLLFYSWIYIKLGSYLDKCHHTQYSREEFFRVIDGFLRSSIIRDGHREEIILNMNLSRIYYFYSIASLELGLYDNEFWDQWNEISKAMDAEGNYNKPIDYLDKFIMFGEIFIEDAIDKKKHKVYENKHISKIYFQAHGLEFLSMAESLNNHLFSDAFLEKWDEILTEQWERFFESKRWQNFMEEINQLKDDYLKDDPVDNRLKLDTGDLGLIFLSDLRAACY